MKYLFVTVLCIICINVNAQESLVKLGEQAVFKLCINEAEPYKCSDAIFTDAITKLITPKIIDEIKNSTFKDGFYTSIFFITDEQGKVIKEDIDIFCENNSLHLAIRDFVSRLPAFSPKNEQHAIRKSAHIYNLTFSPNASYTNYLPSDPLLRIEDQKFEYDSPATFEACKNDKRATFCLEKTISEFVQKNIEAKASTFTTNQRAKVHFCVTPSGKIILTSVKAATEELEKEVRKVFRKIPVAIPAVMKGIPTMQPFATVLFINLG